MLSFTALRSLTVTASVLAVPLSADAQPLIREPIPAAERLFSRDLPEALDGRLALAYRLGRSDGRVDDEGRHPLLGRSVDAKGLRVALQFVAEVGPEQVAHVEAQGCRVDRLESGAVASVGTIVEARCAWTALEGLGRSSQLVRVTPTFGYRPLPPQAAPANTTARHVEAVALREKMRPNGRGKNVVVADVDSGFDPFHPMFFRADGGAYAWLDVNQNGSFDPLVDAVDFDRDGAAGAGERLGMIKANVYWFYGMPNVSNAAGPFVAGVDWLYQDENQDGARNQGSAPPYGDQKPTFGEQLYVADDVNQNGALDVAERIIRLNTHKVKAALLEDQNGNRTTYRRGVDLSAFPSLYPQMEMHGTMVMGTIAGGDPRYNRYAGLAPDAELLLATSSAKDLVTALAWARSEGAQIVLWEMATWYLEYLDGSSPLELACDAAAAEGVLQIGAAGNLGGSQKHRVKTHATGTEIVPLVFPTTQAGYAIGNFNWQGSVSALTVSVTVDGVTVPLSGLNGQTMAGNTGVYWTRAQSTRGTAMLVFYLVAPQNQKIAAQTVQFSVTNSGPATAVHGYVTDDYSSWGLGVHWPVATGATDKGTYGTPGVGDKTLSIGTQFLDFVPDGEVSGALASHSGQGPRADGLDTVDIVAPEDHITAISIHGQVPFGAMMVGGGTSNASPMVVAMAALLKELNPAASPFELRDLLREQAQVEPQMGPIPNDLWGYGKARVYRSHFAGTQPTASSPPVASGTAVRDGTTVSLDATGSSDPEGEALRYFWDLDYDGTFDLGPLDEAKPMGISISETQTHVKLEVIDPHGRAHAVMVEVTEAGLVDAGMPDGGTTDGGATPGSDGGTTGGGSYVIHPTPKPQLGESAGGCGCAGAGAAAAVPFLWALLAMVAGRRRR